MSQDLVFERSFKIGCHDDLAHHVLPVCIAILPSFEKMLQAHQTDPLVQSGCEFQLVESYQKHLVMGKRLPQDVTPDEIVDVQAVTPPQVDSLPFPIANLPRDQVP